MAVRGLTQAMVKKTYSYRYLAFPLICLAYFLVFFHRTSPAVMAAELAKDFGVDPALLGLFGSMYFYAYALCQLPAGILADRWGTRRTIAAFTIIGGIGSLVFGTAATFGNALVGRFLIGMGAGFVYVPALRFLADWFRKDEFATFSGILLSTGNLGQIASAGALAAAMSLIGWRGVMDVVGLASMVVAGSVYLVVRDKPHEVGGADIHEIEDAPPPAAAASLGLFESIKLACRSYNYWVGTLLLLVAVGTFFGFTGLWAGPYLMHVYGMDKIRAGSYISLTAVAMMLSNPLFGILADKVVRRTKPVVIIGNALNIAVWAVLVLKGDSLSPTLIGILFALYGCGQGMTPVLYTNLKENVDLAVTGTAVGFANMLAFGLGGALFQQLMGILIGRAPVVDGVIPASGFRAAFSLGLVALVVATCLFATQKPPARVE